MPRTSSTTWPAGPSEEPEPSTSAPRSLRTSLAPWLANSRACSRPMPRPAPVMTTSRPVLRAQLSPEDLASILPRQVRHEVHAAGALEVGQAVPAEGHELGAQLL